MSNKNNSKRGAKRASKRGAKRARISYIYREVIGYDTFVRRFGKPEQMEPEAIKAAGIPVERVWTEIQGDGGFGYGPGYHLVNRLDHFVTPKARTKTESDRIAWVDTTGRVYEIVCDDPECGDVSDTFSAMDNGDGTFTCSLCEKPGQHLKPGKYLNGVG